MKWFGKTWNAPVNRDTDYAPTPVGEECPVCESRIKEDDQGLLIPYSEGGHIAYHIDCFLYSVGIKRAVGISEKPHQ